MATDIIERLQKIADASRWPNGQDIPLGSQCREAALEIASLRQQVDEARALAYANTDKGPMLWKDIAQDAFDRAEQNRRLVKDAKLELGWKYNEFFELVSPACAVEPEEVAGRDEIARIIDPHSFLPVNAPADETDRLIVDMVAQSKEDALRKADRIIAAMGSKP